MYFKEGDKVYLHTLQRGERHAARSLRSHSVHWHGFRTATVYDGEPEASTCINPVRFDHTMSRSKSAPSCITATSARQHMRWGARQLWRTKQNDLPNNTARPHSSDRPSTSTTTARLDCCRCGDAAPNRLDGSGLHDLHLGVQPLPFANLLDTIRAHRRGYPDTVNPPIARAEEKIAPLSSANDVQSSVAAGPGAGRAEILPNQQSQHHRFYTLSAMGLPMKVVGTGAHILEAERTPSLLRHEFGDAGRGSGGSSSTRPVSARHLCLYTRT